MPCRYIYTAGGMVREMDQDSPIASEERPVNDGRDTRDRILDAAERLFAEKGFDGTSLREITQEAGANVAAVNYHFHSKDELIETVFRRWFTSINQQRIQKLQEAQAAAHPEPACLEAVLRAFLFPVVDACRDGERGRVFRLLLGKIYAAPGLFNRRSFLQQFREMLQHFGPAYVAVIPNGMYPEIFWRMHFVIGGMIHALHNGVEVEMSSGGKVCAHDFGAVREYLVTFAAAALRAPLTGAQTPITHEQWAACIFGDDATDARVPSGAGVREEGETR
jgi:AcrR family transcriptional regulator